MTKNLSSPEEKIMTLEEILNLLGSKNPFLLEVEKDEEGHKQPFTDSGAVAYGNLISRIMSRPIVKPVEILIN